MQNNVIQPIRNGNNNSSVASNSLVAAPRQQLSMNYKRYYRGNTVQIVKETAEKI